MSESFDEVCTSYGNCTWIGRDGVKRAIDRLKAAHEREITEALCDACEQCDRMDKKSYEHEIEHLRKAEYHRGYVAGQRSMDADHAAVATRLRGLRFGGGSHENLGKIAYAIYPCATGWTCESCEGLRDKIIDLLGGVHDEPVSVGASGGADCNCTHHRCDQHGRQVSYDELGNERHKAVCELRNMQLDTGNAIKKLAVALGLEWNPNNAPKSVALLQNRIIHLLGGDEPNLQKSPVFEDSDAEDAVEIAITDELGNERHKAVCELRKVCTKLDESVWTWIEDVAIAIGAQDNQSDEYESMLPKITNRLIHLLGGDQPTLSDLYGILQDGEESENKGSESVSEMTKSAETINLGDKSNGENHKIASITDELRKFKGRINTRTTPEMVLALRAEINCIADRIDERARLGDIKADIWQDYANQMRAERDNLLDLLRDARDEYKMLDQMSAETSANFHAMRDRVWGLEAERDELQEKCDRLNEKVEHQREQLAVYATMYDFDAIRALKRERNEHKHRADNAEGHVKSLEHRLDAAHETYCALLNDAAREFRALTEERDELRRSLRQIAERTGVPHDLDLSEYGDKKIANAVIGQLGETKRYVKALEWVRDRRLPKIEAKRDELQAKLDDYDKTHVALPKDEDGEVIHVGDELDGYAKTIEVVELRYGRSGWVIVSRDGNAYADTYAFTHHHKPTVEQVIRDLTLGKITESQAIERIEGING